MKRSLEPGNKLNAFNIEKLFETPVLHDYMFTTFPRLNFIHLKFVFSLSRFIKGRFRRNRHARGLPLDDQLGLGLVPRVHGEQYHESGQILVPEIV